MWVNGEEGAGISALDRGLGYGDGVFESMRFGARGIPLLELHLERLATGCERLRIAPDLARVRDEIERAVAASLSAMPRGVVKLIVTRGPGPRGYRTVPDAVPTRILVVSALPDHPAAWAEEGVSVRYCDTRLGTNATLAGIKHLNRLEQVLARLEWSDPDIAEGLMSDLRGRVVEGISTNVFLASGGRLITPTIDFCGVAGVMRRYLLDALPRDLGLPVTETSCERAVFAGAQELFLCNAVVGVWPIRQLSTRVLPVGPLTRKAQVHVARLFED